ncbi:GerAB/ArcD/ProY family transporter [Neobacillus kokaensis]|uniref:Germination protein n=1 Tax=Neobacillus kokaensis TaxID=2759023 RepID=A0ABQ3NAG2_9BACI|nr:endospore germination permease [Neobacillus kokaensis]GHI00421.1 germination protein [Neobacillus kokaensis]
MNTVKISARQFALIVIFFSVGSTILTIPGGMTQAAKQDAWIGAILGTGISFILVFLYITITKMFPQLTLVELNEKILGKWIGRIVSLCFIFFAFYSSALMLADVGDFLTIQILPETPNAALQILFAIIVIMGVRLGLETLARSAEILFICFMVLFIILVITLLPKVELENIQPIFESGKPIIKAAFLYICYFSLPLVVLLMVFPASVNQPKKAEKNFYISILISGTILLCLIILTILVVGSTLSAHQLYPSYALARMINLENFLQRIEAIMAAMWFITLYFKMVFYFFAAVIGLAQTLKLNDYLPLTLPLGMILVLLSLLVNPNTVAAETFNTDIWPLLVSTYGLGLPILLLAVQYSKKNFQRNKQQK